MTIIDLAVVNAGVGARLAPAKVNLALHVVGRRPDGYHELESLAVFTRFGDRIEAAPADGDELVVTGKYAAAVPLDDGNLIVRAREALRGCFGAAATPPVRISLEKNLPVASGIGGGSSDAAATLLALDRFWDLGLGFGQLAALGLTLGADLPMCLHGAAHGTPLSASGIGEDLRPLECLPALPMLLVNDGTALATPDVFRALTRRDNPALPAFLAGSSDIEALCAGLGATRNDLLPAALALAPRIGDKLARLKASGALHAQMSGSGATCFAIFADDDALQAAAARIARAQPDWFVLPTRTVASAV